MKGDNNSNIKIHFIIPFIAILILEFIGILYLKSLSLPSVPFHFTQLLYGSRLIRSTSLRSYSLICLVAVGEGQHTTEGT